MSLDPNELRKLSALLDPTDGLDAQCAKTLSQAADEIERLRAALGWYGNPLRSVEDDYEIGFGVGKRARAALTGKEDV